MIDLNLVKNNRNFLEEGLKTRGYDPSKVAELARLLEEQATVRREIEEKRRQRNLIQKDPSIPNEEKKNLRDAIRDDEETLRLLSEKVDPLHLDIPNLPDRNAPIGESEADNKVIRECKSFFEPAVGKTRSHWEIGKEFDILDIEGASALSGSMFALFKGKGAKLLRSLIDYGLRLNEEKYPEILPPHMVSSQTLTYTGHLPKFADEQYKASQDDLWLIPSAEIPLTGYFANKTYNLSDLPKYAMGYTACFRREAGSYGKETRGLQRVHEFHKVELVKIVPPEKNEEELEDLLADCLRIIEDLKLRYRIVDICTGDMGDKYSRCFDIEVFAPGIERWLEVSSVGTFTDYQARRAKIKYKDSEKGNGFAYTLNGSGMATPRVWAAIIETYQQPDGRIKVPDILVDFMGCEYIG